jgi:hypothetical protein
VRTNRSADVFACGARTGVSMTSIRSLRKTPAAELDEEEYVQATQRYGLHGEEIAGKHARGLLAKEHRPAHGCAPRRRLEPSGGKHTSDRAR